MSNRKLVGIVICTFALIFGILSCKKNSGSSTPKVTLSDTAKTVSENVGSVSITVTLSKEAKNDVTIQYSLSGSAVQNGDYEVDSTSNLTIAAGSKTGTLQFNIFDDAVPESAKVISVKFSSSGNVDFESNSANITINDNDSYNATAGLQTDLTWDAGSLVDLDLYVATNVVINGNSVDSFDLVSGSEAEKGFESVFIDNSDPDGDYYIVVFYATGSRSVNYKLIFNGPGITNIVDSSDFTAAEVNNALFFGPINKAGSTYSRMKGSRFTIDELRRIPYRGELRKE